MQRSRVALPIEPGANEIALMMQKLPQSKVILSIEANAKESGGLEAGSRVASHFCAMP